MIKQQIVAMLLLAVSALATAEAVTASAAAEPTAAAAASPADTAEVPTEIFIEAPEPRYVAPTRRDRIGRIWAPVYINGKGPFRLVLDTGASRSAVTGAVASALGVTSDPAESVTLHSATGTRIVPTIRVDTLLVGDVLINGSKLPILPDALGGAQGILGYEGLTDRRVLVDFRNDLIVISRSHSQRAAYGFVTIPFTLERGRLLVARVQLGRVSARAIIDTGAQATVGNLALRDALQRQRKQELPTSELIESVTNEVQPAEGRSAPPIEFGDIAVASHRLAFADLRIFEFWQLAREPTLLVGMDVLGLFDTLIIDYRRHELQLRMRVGS